MSDSASWPAFALMGAYHGINPAMGWLFAVALGLQRQSASAMWRALPPLALGHAASIAVVVIALSGAQNFLTPATVRYGSGALLLGFAIYLLVRRSHLRWVGMQLGFKDLTLWSFLMSSAHGAGLMLVPVLLHGVAVPEGHAMSGHEAEIPNASAVAGLVAVAVHSVSMYVVMGALALLTFRTLGVGVLRRAWINLDVLWAGALVIAGVATLTVW